MTVCCRYDAYIYSSKRYNMKKAFLIILVSILTISSNAQTDNNNIVIGKIDSFNSTTLKENRKIWVYLPNDNPNNKQRYPVLYLLDGEGHFQSVVGMIQ